MPKFTYIRDTTVQKIVIESQYKHYISDKITKVAEPGETYTITGILWNKKKVATERLYSINWGGFTFKGDEEEFLTRQQIIDKYEVDPENLESDLEYSIEIYYTNDRITKTFDDMPNAMDWVNNRCPDFKDLTRIEEVL